MFKGRVWTHVHKKTEVNLKKANIIFQKLNKMSKPVAIIYRFTEVTYCMQYVSVLKYLLFTDPRQLFKYVNCIYLQRMKACISFASKSEKK